MTLPAWMTKEGGEQPMAQAPPALGGLNGKSAGEDDQREIWNGGFMWVGAESSILGSLARVDISSRLPRAPQQSLNLQLSAHCQPPGSSTSSG